MRKEFLIFGFFGIVLVGFFIFLWRRERFSSIIYTGDNEAFNECLALCPGTEPVCSKICNEWTFYLSSGGRFPCPSFMGEDVCKKFAKF